MADLRELAQIVAEVCTAVGIDATAAREIAQRSGVTTDAALDDVKRYAKGVIQAETQARDEDAKRQRATAQAELNDRFAKLEARVLGEAGVDDGELGQFRISSRAADAQVLKKVASRLSDFEAQVTTQMATMQGDLEKKITFVGSGARPVGTGDVSAAALQRDLDQLKFDCGELKDLLNTTRS